MDSELEKNYLMNIGIYSINFNNYTILNFTFNRFMNKSLEFYREYNISVIIYKSFTDFIDTGNSNYKTIFWIASTFNLGVKLVFDIGVKFWTKSIRCNNNCLGNSNKIEHVMNVFLIYFLGIFLISCFL